MTREEIDALLKRHFDAELAGDVPAIVATFSDDIEHDVVGRQINPLRGKEAVGAFYKEFLPDLEHTRVIPVRRFYADDVAVDEAIVEGYAHGRPFDLEGYGRPRALSAAPRLRAARRAHRARERVVRSRRDPPAARAAERGLSGGFRASSRAR